MKVCTWTFHKHPIILSLRSDVEFYFRVKFVPWSSRLNLKKIEPFRKIQKNIKEIKFYAFGNFSFAHILYHLLLDSFNMRDIFLTHFWYFFSYFIFIKWFFGEFFCFCLKTNIGLQPPTWSLFFYEKQIFLWWWCLGTSSAVGNFIYSFSFCPVNCYSCETLFFSPSPVFALQQRVNLPFTQCSILLTLLEFDQCRHVLVWCRKHLHSCRDWEWEHLSNWPVSDLCGLCGPSNQKHLKTNFPLAASSDEGASLYTYVSVCTVWITARIIPPAQTLEHF